MVCRGRRGFVRALGNNPRAEDRRALGGGPCGTLKGSRRPRRGETHEKTLDRLRRRHRALVPRPGVDRRPHLPGDAADSRPGRHDGRHGGRSPAARFRRARTSGSRWAAWRSARSGATAATSPPTGRPTGCTGRRSFILDDWAQADFAGGLRPARRRSGRPQLQSRLERADADEHATTRPRGRVTVAPVRAEAFEANLEHYADVFAQRQRRVRHPAGRADRPRHARGSWPRSSSGPPGPRPPTGPATTITYTNNWPHEPLVGNRPTGETVVWTGVSIIVLLAGIAAMVWWYALAKRGGAARRAARRTDPLLALRRHAVAAGDRQVLLGRVGADPRADPAGRRHRPLRRRGRRLLRHPAGRRGCPTA